MVKSLYDAGVPRFALRCGEWRPDYIVNRTNTAGILSLVGTLLDDLSHGKSSSFAQATKGLVTLPMPRDAW
jgi:hypothetical protein